MTMLDQPPVPERELPAARRAAIRDLLVAEAASPYPARPAFVTRRRLALAAASVAGVLAVVQFWPAEGGGLGDPPVPEYVAAWNPVPIPVDPDLAGELGDQCLTFFLEAPPMVLPEEGWDRILVDRRGTTAIVLLVNPVATYALKCFYRDVGQEPAANAEGPGRRIASAGMILYTPLASGESLLPVDTGYTYSESEGHGVGFSFGQTAPDVARVTIALGNGGEMEASLEDGWYLAWWPGRVDLAAGWPNIDAPAELITAYDASGTELAQQEAHQGD
jgi:hypothetical protein